MENFELLDSKYNSFLNIDINAVLGVHMNLTSQSFKKIILFIYFFVASLGLCCSTYDFIAVASLVAEYRL